MRTRLVSRKMSRFTCTLKLVDFFLSVLPFFVLFPVVVFALQDTIDDVLVHTQYGDISGYVANNAPSGMTWNIFRGIPYAAPPIGKQRWRPPSLPDPWKPDVLDATSFGPDCAQLGPAWPTLTESAVRSSSEDCLYLNIYAPLMPPKLARASRRENEYYQDRNDREEGVVDEDRAASSVSHPPASLPVLIYFPAGDFFYGAANDIENNLPFFNMSNTTVEESVVVVTVNYRIGVFGFLGSEGLRNRSSDGSTGHYGILDQRLAMQWVRENIQAFGGDPSQITIAGESAGASSVTLHLVMPESWPFFDRVIIESGAFNNGVNQSISDSQAVFDALMEALSCDPDFIPCLLEQNTSTLLHLTDYSYSNSSAPLPYRDTATTCQWAPPIDGVQLQAAPTVLLEAGKIAPVPILLGTNADEGTYFTGGLPRDLREDDFRSFLSQSYGASHADALMALYPPEQYVPERTPVTDCQGEVNCGSPSFWAASHVVGDSAILCPTQRAARNLALAGKGKAEGGDDQEIYSYFFDHAPERTLNFPGLAEYPEGAFHGEERREREREGEGEREGRKGKRKWEQ